jgi:hypothetical protein
MFEVLGYSIAIIYIFSLYPVYKIINSNSILERIAFCVLWPFVVVIILLVAYWENELQKHLFNDKK